MMNLRLGTCVLLAAVILHVSLAVDFQKGDDNTETSSSDEDDEELDARTVQFTLRLTGSSDGQNDTEPEEPEETLPTEDRYEVSSNKRNAERNPDAGEPHQKKRGLGLHTHHRTGKTSGKKIPGTPSQTASQRQLHPTTETMEESTSDDTNSDIDEGGRTGVKQVERERAVIMNSDDYNLALQLLNRQKPIPLKHRDREQRKMYIKISKHKLTASRIHDPLVEEKVERLVKGNRIVLPEEEIGPCIDKFHMISKGEGARKLMVRLKSYYHGIGTKTIQGRLNKSKRQQKENPKFLNKAPLKTITAKRKMERHQIDLVDLSKLAVTIDDITYRYVLSIMDVFCRFLWLRPMNTKSSDHVAAELQKLYTTVGYPSILQCDRGPEFFGAVKKFCAEKNIKMIHSGPYHPQSQGKIERSHGSWKSKLEYDVADGQLNWVRNLESYQELYNTGMHTAIGMTPYECFVGSKRIGGGNSTQEDVNKRQEEAYKNSQRAAERMKKRFKSKNALSIYTIGELVFVRRRPKGKIGKRDLAQPKVVQGRIIEKNEDGTKLKIEIEGNSQWHSVKDITSLTHDKEKTRRKMNMKSKKGDFEIRLEGLKTKAEKKSLYKTLFLMTKRGHASRGDRAEGQLEVNANIQGLTIEQQNDGGGNCLFIALAQQLEHHGISRNHSRIRKELVDFLRKFGIQGTNGTSINLSDFVYDHNSLDSYLEEMAQDGVWGDHIMLLAFANLYSTDIYVVSSVAEEPLIIQPMNGTAQMSVALGHIHEMHYLSLAPVANPEVNEGDSCEDHGTAASDQLNQSTFELCHVCGRMECDDHKDMEDTDEDTEISLKKPHPQSGNTSNDTIVYSPSGDNYSQVNIDAALSQLEQAAVESINTLATIELSVGPEIMRFGADHCSEVWSYFMKKACKATMTKVRENEEDFFLIDSRYMRSHDYFKEVLNGMAFIVLFMTPLVKKFLRKYNVGKVVDDLLFLDNEDAKIFQDYMMFEFEREENEDA